MLPHEEFLKIALEVCMISKLVDDLGVLYVSLIANDPKYSMEEFFAALKVSQILQKASEDIAALGPKPKIPHPMDVK